MDHQDFALTVIAVSVLVGLYLGTGTGIQDFRQFYFPGEEKPVIENQSANDSLVYGSAHDHALFYAAFNGSELDLSAERFQLNSRYVHLENRRSDIVHKHAEGVTWERFLETINVSVRNESSQLCLEVYNQSRCGNGTVVLNGDRNPGLDKEIQQGDNFAIIIGGDVESLVEDYMQRKLPRAYKSESSRGQRV